MDSKQAGVLKIAVISVLLAAAAGDKPEEFDFIIVAAGISGSVVARRISDNPKWRVLVLEEGSAVTEDNNIPLNVNRLKRDCTNSFGFVYEPSDDYCRSMKRRQCILRVNKGLGGQSVLGDMVYNRGNRRDYDEFCRQGNKGWCFKDVLPFFKKLENNTIPGEKVESCCQDGPVTISYPNYRTELAAAFMEAGKELGYPWTNYNRRSQTGFAPVQMTLKDGLRQNIYDTYLAPVVDARANLVVETESKVTKLLFGRHHVGKQSKVRVTGVQYNHLGFLYTVKATREVIITSSTVEVAQLLMLSGVGPAKHLQSLGIPVVKNLPVGANFHDIVGTGFVFFSDVPVPDLEKTFTKAGISKFLKTRSGPAASAVIEALAFLESSPKCRDYPDYQLTLRCGSILSMPMRRSIYNINDTIGQQQFGEVADQGAYSFQIVPTVSRPKSRGRVLLRSADPDDLPIVHGNFYHHPDDMQVMLRAIRTLHELMDTEAFKAINGYLYDKTFEPCSHFEHGSDKYWDCYARYFTVPMDRWAGTTKMGPRRDKQAVVDAELRVHGIRNLRIVSPSIAPQQVTGQVDGFQIMLGEKAADMICKYQNLVDEIGHGSSEGADSSYGYSYENGNQSGGSQ
jgi:choline dehydrogenase-like flavoprotein